MYEENFLGVSPNCTPNQDFLSGLKVNLSESELRSLPEVKKQ